MTKHIPVLFEEVREQLHLQKGMVVVDATFGGGSHASMMLEAVSPNGRVIALDADKQALSRFEEKFQSNPMLEQASKEGRLVLVHSNYGALEEVLERLGVSKVNGILADLGFSSDQIEEATRGFSFQKDGPLDMRLNQEAGITARDIVNTFSEKELGRILRDYGDEPEWRLLTRTLIAHRAEQPITTTKELANLIETAYPKRRRATMKIHSATKTFQALRIAVNEEFTHLEAFLKQAVERLELGGRLAVITFHSGEDRLVKERLREYATGCICPPEFPVCRCGRVPQVRLVTKKPIVPTEKEVSQNPRARSAKLRVIEKVS
jgi:16S rRNA (cytosine1402-N4)-methyltransferase